MQPGIVRFSQKYSENVNLCLNYATILCQITFIYIEMKERG